MRAFYLSLLLALGSLGLPTLVQGACDKCPQPNCQCGDDCNPSCKCCGPKAAEGAEQGCPIPHRQSCPGPNCPITPQPILVEPIPVEPDFGQNSTPRFAPSRTPVTVDGIRVTADLPVSLHKRNTGGMGRRGPGSGAGLCVYTSAWHAAMWQNIPDIYGFRDWMQNKPGGSWPEKFDATIKQYCKEKGVAVPEYIQHTGGDVDFLKFALKTGRMVCVTYAGRDDFYRDRWGQPAAIAHMVNLVYLDERLAVIVDNNRPGVFLRMSASDFTERWLAMSGGWAFVFTAPAPPPYASKPVQEFLAGPADTFLVNPDGQEAVVPEGLPVEENPVSYAEGIKQSKEKDVPLVIFVGDYNTPLMVHGCVVAKAKTLTGFNAGDVVVSRWIDGKHMGIKTTIGAGADIANYGAEIDRAVAQLDPQNAKTIANFGVDFTKISREKRYSISGNEASKRAAFDKLKLEDDSVKANVTFVGGDLAKNKALWSRVPADLRAKFNVQFYEASNFAVSQFGLKDGVTLRESDAPNIDRVGREVKVVPTGDLTDQIILALLNEFLNPRPTPPVVPPTPQPPVPTPPSPSPDQPVTPTPAPGPSPTPQPEPLITDRNLLVAALGALALYLIRKYL